jgi:hypothetical protein
MRNKYQKIFLTEFAHFQFASPKNESTKTHKSRSLDIALLPSLVNAPGLHTTINDSEAKRGTKGKCLCKKDYWECLASPHFLAFTHPPHCSVFTSRSHRVVHCDQVRTASCFVCFNALYCICLVGCCCVCFVHCIRLVGCCVGLLVCLRGRCERELRSSK